MRVVSLILAALVLVACTPKPTVNANAFDMICVEHGTAIMSNGTRKSDSGTIRYSIDLDRMSWCQTEDCQDSLWPVSRFDAGVIVLNEDEAGKTEVRRASGDISTNMAGRFGIPDYVSSGKCTKAPFTPLPPSKF